MNDTYRFINHRPGRYRLRDGSLGKNERTMEQWQIALEGHIARSHSGIEQKDCAGCKELREKARAA